MHSTPTPYNKSGPQSNARLAPVLRARIQSAALRQKLGADILWPAAELTSVAELSCRSHAELVLSSVVSDILIKIIDTPNAEDAAAKLHHWIAEIPSHGRIKLRVEAHVYDQCAHIIGNMPTTAAIRRRLWATVGRVRRTFNAVACSRKSSSARSRYAKLVVVSYFWTHDYWCNKSTSAIAHTLGLRRQALESARLVINRHLPKRTRFPEFSTLR